MDDVVCQGDEVSLQNCIFTGWGSSDCGIDEPAGVLCLDDEVAPPSFVKRKPGERLHNVMDVRNVSLRIVGGRGNNEGRVEVSLHPD